MLITTTDSIDRPYDLIGLVTATTFKLKVDPEVTTKALAEKAKEKGADAIICFRYQYEASLQIAYGTAIKFK
ncbi:hypothetical protein ASG16_001930 [Brevibacillus sp. Leaf182]|nr:hypothetical protein ASG16_001930 [Brevibacillus sp. Leaf182]